MTALRFDTIKPLAASPVAEPTARDPREDRRFAERLAEAADGAPRARARDGAERGPSTDAQIANSQQAPSDGQPESHGKPTEAKATSGAARDHAEPDDDQTQTSEAEAPAVVAADALVQASIEEAQPPAPPDEQAEAAPPGANAAASEQPTDAAPPRAEGHAVDAGAPELAVDAGDAEASTVTQTEEAAENSSAPPRVAETAASKLEADADPQAPAAAAQSEGDAGERSNDESRRDGQPARHGLEPSSRKADPGATPIEPTSADTLEGDERREARATSASTEVRVEPSSSHDAPSRSVDRAAPTRAAVERGGEAAQREAPPEVDAGRFVSRVTRAFQAAGERGGVVQLRLSPPELGTLQVRLAVTSDGALSATLDTDNAAARNLLLDNLPALRERLAEQDIRVEKFDVNVGRDGGGRGDPRAGGGEPDARSHGQRNERATPREAHVSDATPAPAPGPAATDQINLIV